MKKRPLCAEDVGPEVGKVMLDLNETTLRLQDGRVGVIEHAPADRGGPDGRAWDGVTFYLTVRIKGETPFGGTMSLSLETINELPGDGLRAKSSSLVAALRQRVATFGLEAEFCLRAAVTRSSHGTTVEVHELKGR